MSAGRLGDYCAKRGWMARGQSRSGHGRMARSRVGGDVQRRAARGGWLDEKGRGWRTKAGWEGLYAPGGLRDHACWQIRIHRARPRTSLHGQRARADNASRHWWIDARPVIATDSERPGVLQRARWGRKAHLRSGSRRLGKGARRIVRLRRLFGVGVQAAAYAGGRKTWRKPRAAGKRASDAPASLLLCRAVCQSSFRATTLGTCWVDRGVAGSSLCDRRVSGVQHVCT
ncbi:hypothetical protein DFH08DRAFT_862726 [Mycena albidolilacea]|uniref:Uncharacterized protein n=1 Tax=Mycena albidolilacea TaxID=1033008 RepID=A0AAD7A4T7_9AGAR|nr:hypothetical protein DFH08DRAFT_862726 [Mycena albidolilacea]